MISKTSGPSMIAQETSRLREKHLRPSEVRLTLGLERGELVRGFVREAALLEGARPVIAGLIADDTFQAWLVLSAHASGRETADVIVTSSARDVRCSIHVKGHDRFSSLIDTVSDFLRRDAGLSIREWGIDGWELSFHRRIAAEIEIADLSKGENSVTSTPATDSVTIDLPRREDAPGIARCFLEVYGRNYVHTEVFSPQRYWSKVDAGELIPVLARNERGEVVGHVALEREPGSSIAERGEAVVLSAYRGRHLLEKMTERLSQEANRVGLLGIFAVPVTIHTFSQRNDERAGMPVCAALLGYAPEGSHPKGETYPTTGQRQSNLITFRFLTQPSERAIHAPDSYREIMLQIYARLGVKVATCARLSPAVAESKTGISIDHRAYGKIHFAQIGANVGIELRQAVRDVLGLGARAVQLSALVSDPGLPLLAEEARSQGFFFCGVGPAFCDGEDILMLQFLVDPLDVSKLQLYADPAKELVSFIEKDRAGRSIGSA